MKRVSDAGRSLPPRAHPSTSVGRSVAGLSSHLASCIQTLFLGHAVDSALQTILSAPLGESAGREEEIAARPSARTEQTLLRIMDPAAALTLNLRELRNTSSGRGLNKKKREAFSFSGCPRLPVFSLRIFSSAVGYFFFFLFF